MSDIIKIGTQDATFKVGSSAVTAIFLGSTQVYPQGEPPTPVGFKYKLTLSNGDIVSAETDATSAITRNEVSAYSATCVSAEIGDTVTSIGASTFNGFNNLSSVTIGTNVTTINVYAFNRCSGLTEVVIPDSVTYIGGSAFDNCKSISSITLSNNITQIGMGAFRSCSNLQNIVLPSSVTSIEGQAFLFDSSLQSITVNASNPPVLGSDVFLETGNCPIYCPCDSVNTYKQTSGWASYSSRITCVPTPTHEYVDLGLPSGTLWATMNVGASSETDYGNYYQYGKGADDYSVTSGQSDYSGTENPLAASADTATQVWGGNWHTPTHAQWQELTTNTTYTWTTINGVNGGKFTASNGNYVFFPAAGYWLGDIQNFVGSEGGYWSSSPDDSSNAYRLNFNTFFNDVNVYSRSSGSSIRPVMDN